MKKALDITRLENNGIRIDFDNVGAVVVVVKDGKVVVEASQHYTGECVKDEINLKGVC